MICSFFNKCQFNKLILESLTISGIFVLILCCFFNPLWETNDDVAMSMVAHGYGIAAIATPHIIFSNILWGHLVHSIPTIYGVVGYSIATVIVLFIIGSVIFYSLYRLKASYLISLSGLILILTRPILFPQFTLNSGLLLMASILLWNLSIKQNNKRLLTLGFFLAFCSWLIRSQEFLFVFLVAIPLLPWKTFFSKKWSKIVLIHFILLFLGIIGSTILDRQAYKGNEWKEFNELNPVRSLFTDFHVGELLKQHPDIISDNGYTYNDINLFAGWFFVDPALANPPKLKAMLSKLGSAPPSLYSLKNGWLGVKSLWHPILLVTLLAAVLLALIYPSWKLVSSWVLFISVLFFLGFFGRPGILRVYFPVLDLLVLAPLLTSSVSKWRYYLSSGVLFFAATITFYLCAIQSKAANTISQKVVSSLSCFPTSPVIVWGASLPYEKIYSVLGFHTAIPSYQFYSLGCFTLAPFSVAYAEEKEGRNMIALLGHQHLISIIAPKYHLNLLKIYCKEHLGQELQEISKKKFSEGIEIIECRVK